MNPLREEIRAMLEVERRAGGYRAVMKVDAGLSVFPDHFRGDPILPGMCMVQAVLVAGGGALGVGDLELRGMKQAKFQHPVRPGDLLVIDAGVETGEDGGVRIKAKLSVESRGVAEISLTAAPVGVKEGV